MSTQALHARLDLVDTKPAPDPRIDGRPAAENSGSDEGSTLGSDLGSDLASDLGSDLASQQRPHPAAPPGRAKALALPTLSGLLRGLGGLVIVAAFVTFLFQGWQQGDALTRYVLLVGHTLALTLAGFAVGHLLHEGKGARLFIGLALVSVPVSFAFLGGLTYEHLTWEQGLTTAAPNSWQTALWHTAVPQTSLAAGLALPLTLASVPLLGLAIWIGFLVMARRSARPLALSYLLANGALLIPVRDNTLVAAILLASALALAVGVVRLRRGDPSLATPEGVLARAVLLLPLLVMGGRSIWLYAPGDLFFTTLALIGYVGLRQVLGQTGDDVRWRVVVEWAAGTLAVVGAVFAFATVSDLDLLSGRFALPIAGVILAVLLVDLSTQVRTGAAAYRNTAAATVAATLMLDLFSFGGTASALACLVGGIATLSYGFTARQRSVFAMGLVTALAGIAFAGYDAVSAFSLGGWAGLVVVGALAILTGSLIERKGEAILAAALRWNRHFDENE